ncbi:MAG: NAD(P)-dependent oxidoreductase [Pseudomonadota bacterium]|nr:oxidoreductase [Gammaproteobacteria bacterium]MEE2683576.1 NAD(P)-dependent oxidoreductase [Pseudomonadota bacterium]|tara:strand:+ start:210 stop:1103 length:894 start_codon:yes stop_codon:yes gene_type:complete
MNIDRSKYVGVVGLGIMGGAISQNLVKSGFTVFGFDIALNQLKKAEAYGVKIVKSIDEISQKADYILTSLPTVEALDFFSQQIIQSNSIKDRKILVAELSTFPITSKQESYNILLRNNIVMLDCPLSGTGAQALDRDLAIYASGDEEGYNNFLDIFKGFSRVQYFLGEYGNGTKMKLIANLLVHVHNVVAAEAISLGLKGGLDPHTICDIIGSGAGSSRMFEMRAPMMVKGKYKPATMKIDIWKKDMELISNFIDNHDLISPTFEAAKDIYSKALEEGLGSEDTAAVYEIVKKLKNN